MPVPVTGGAGGPAVGGTAGADGDSDYTLRCNMQPPNINNFTCYKDFKDKVILWECLIDHKPAKLGLLLANALPDVSKLYGNNLSKSLLKKYLGRQLAVEGGLKLVTDWLDEKLGKNKLLSQINAYAALDLYKRQPDQGIVQFVSEFDL